MPQHVPQTTPCQAWFAQLHVSYMFQPCNSIERSYYLALNVRSHPTWPILVLSAFHAHNGWFTDTGGTQTYNVHHFSLYGGAFNWLTQHMYMCRATCSVLITWVSTESRDGVVATGEHCVPLPYLGSGKLAYMCLQLSVACHATCWHLDR